MDGRTVRSWFHGYDIQRQQGYVCRTQSFLQAIHADFDNANLLLGIFSGLGKRNGAVLGLASDLDVATSIGPETSRGGEHFDQPPTALQRVNSRGFERAHKVHRCGVVKLKHHDGHLRLTEALSQTLYKISFQLAHSHTASVDLSQRRQIDVAVGIDPKRLFVNLRGLWRPN